MVRTFGVQAENWELLSGAVVTGAQPMFVPGMKFRKKIGAEGLFVVAGDHSTTPSIQGALVSGRIVAESLLKD